MTTKAHSATFLFTILIGSTSFLVSDGQAQNLILNGSFESPGTFGNAGVGREQYLAPSTAITGWTVAGTGDVFLHKSPDIGTDPLAGSTFNFAQNGNVYLDLSGSGAPHATIYQDFPTTPLVTYTLSFYIGAALDPGQTINVQLTGVGSLLNTNLTPNAAGTNINWVVESFTFTADSNTTRLSFQDTSTADDNASFVDSVSVVGQDDDLIASIHVSAVDICWPGHTNLMYQVQYRTNPTGTIWIDLGSPVQGTGTNCVTDATSGEQRFYRVVRVP